jgi:hypothetical protein
MNALFFIILLAIDFAAITSLFIVLRPYLKKYIIERPKLELELQSAEGSYCIRKWQINEENQEEEPIYVYEVCWCYNIIIRNLSKYDAHFPLLKPNLALPYSTSISILNHYVPIYAASQTTVNVTYKILNSSTESKKVIPEGIPTEIRRVKFLLEYTNEHKKKFYTVFDCETNSNSKHFMRPSGF